MELRSGDVSEKSVHLYKTTVDHASRTFGFASLSLRHAVADCSQLFISPENLVKKNEGKATEDTVSGHSVYRYINLPPRAIH